MPYAPSQGQSGQGPYYNDDQWADYMKLGDLTGQEQQIAQQQALAQQLRGSAGQNGRMDVGSQIGRGLSGIGGALSNVAAMQGMKDLSTQRKNFMNTIANRGRGNLPIAPPSPGGVPGYDPSQFNDFTGGYGGGG